MRDLHSNVRILKGIDPQACGTTGPSNGVLSSVVDLQGFQSAEFVYSMGVSVATSDTVTPIVYESDTTTTGDFTAVADADLLGTEAALSPSQALKVGYRGNKRYLRLRLYGTGTATALVAAQAILGNADEAPVDATAG